VQKNIQLVFLFTNWANKATSAFEKTIPFAANPEILFWHIFHK
jgi:hypothetical protein